MNKQFPHVLSPIRLNGKLYRNRIAVAPSTLHSTSNGELYPTEEAMLFFEQRAKTGAGVVYCAGAKAVDLFDDGVHTVWSTRNFNGKNKLSELSRRIHAHGALAGMEIIGIMADSDRGPLSCSAGNRIMGSPPISAEITREEMAEYRDATAKLCGDLMECGFDALLFHFGHSVPLAQFLSPLTNRRTDEYGGNTENRCRYLAEILDACRNATRGRVVLEVRMSATEFEAGGIDLEEGIAIAALLQDHCDIIQASCGMVTEKYSTYTHPCGHMPPHPNLRFAEAFKASGRIHKPVTAVGAFESLQAAEDAIAAGKCDFVAMARQLIADPETITKAIAGKSEDVVPCIRCMRCHDSTCLEHQFSCSVNPRVGLESCYDRMFPAAPSLQKRVAVVGGGPAGMKAALVACDRGHTVTLFEARDTLGGALVFADYVPFKYPLRDYKNYLIAQIRKRPIRVELGREVLPAELDGRFDAVIIAVGAQPLVLPIPGFGPENGIFATDVYGREDSLGETVTVIGGGQVGCETALHLADQGKKVTIVEMQESLCPDASKTCGDEIRVLLSEHPNVTVLCSARCAEVAPGTVRYADTEGTVHTLSSHTVVLAAGMAARTALADSFVTECSVPEWRQIGDCVRARTVEQASAEGFWAAMDL